MPAPSVIGRQMQGVWGCRLWGMWRMPGGGSVTSWTERSGGHGAACQLVGIRQRAGAGGRWLGYGPACFYADGQRPAAGQVRLGVWAGVAAHLAVGEAAGVPRGRAGPHRGQRLAGAALSLPPFFLGPAILVAVIRWPPAAASDSLWPVGGRPPRGPVLCTVWVAFWPVGGPSCAAGEVQHGEGWPWRQPVAGDPGARTAWRSAC
jgi:hypothetical protein